MRVLLLAVLLALAPVPEARAAFDSSSAGTATGQFLKLGADARSAGMGEAVGAAAEDASALYWNPAGLAALEKREVLLSHAFLYQSLYADLAVFACPLSPAAAPRRREFRPSGLGTLALGALYLSAGDIPEMDNSGTATGGSVKPYDLAVMAGWGASLSEHLDAGIAIKFIDSRITRSARSGAADAGLRWHTLLGDQWPYVAAFSGSNFGGRLRYREKTEQLPTVLRFGQSLRLMRNWLLAVDAVGPSDGRPYANVGSETSWPFTDATAFVRAGWSGRTMMSDLDGITGFSFGFGARLAGGGFDYAWAPYGVLGQAHRFAFTYRF
ncbi:MAG: PorV/PorQ family protein [Elusimicrobiota bacterium]|jgi:hypothetical protein